MSVRLLFFGVILIGIAGFRPLRAQVEGNGEGNETRETPYIVISTAGDTLRGTFLRWSGDTLVLRAQDATVLQIRRGDIRRVMEWNTFEENETQDAATAEILAEFARRPASGFILQSSAWPKPDGRVEITLYEFTLLSAAVSLKNLVTFSGMSTFSLGGDNVAGFGMKLSPLVTETAALAGGLYAVEGYDRSTEGFRVYYFCGSFMIGDGSLTIGYGHFEDDDESIPAPYLGFDIPVSSRIRAMLELSNLSRGIGVRMQAGRTMVELGVVQLPSRGDYATVPWLGLGVAL